MADVDTTNVETTHQTNAKALEKLNLSNSKEEEEEQPQESNNNNEPHPQEDDNSIEKDKEKERRQVEYVSPEDPNYNADRTVFADPNNFTIKHPLQNRWTLWYDNPGKQTSQASWANSLKKIVTFDTVCMDTWSSGWYQYQIFGEMER